MLEIGGIQFEEKEEGILSPVGGGKMSVELVGNNFPRITAVLQSGRVILASFISVPSQFDQYLLKIPPYFFDDWHQDYPQGLSAVALFNRSANNQRGSTQWRLIGGPTVQIDWALNPLSVLIFNNLSGEHRGVYNHVDEKAEENQLYKLKIY